MYRNFYTDETALAVCLKETMYVCMQLYSRNIFRNKRLLRCEVCFSQHYLRYIRGLPINDTPEIFALHENANITFAQNETFSLLRGILKMQPRSSSGSGRSREEVCVRNGVTCNAGAYSWRQVTGGGGGTEKSKKQGGSKTPYPYPHPVGRFLDLPILPLL